MGGWTVKCRASVLEKSPRKEVKEEKVTMAQIRFLEEEEGLRQ